jgi:hypothetical protein
MMVTQESQTTIFRIEGGGGKADRTYSFRDNVIYREKYRDTPCVGRLSLYVVGRARYPNMVISQHFPKGNTTNNGKTHWKKQTDYDIWFYLMTEAEPAPKTSFSS